MCSYLYVTSVWNKTNDFLIRKKRRKNNNKNTNLAYEWSMNPITSNPVLSEVGHEALIWVLRQNEGGWVGFGRGWSHHPCRSHVFTDRHPTTHIPQHHHRIRLCRIVCSAASCQALDPAISSILVWFQREAGVDRGRRLPLSWVFPPMLANSLHLAAQGALRSLSLSAINCASAEMIYF